MLLLCHILRDAMMLRCYAAMLPYYFIIAADALMLLLLPCQRADSAPCLYICMLIFTPLCAAEALRCHYFAVFTIIAAAAFIDDADATP